MNWEVQAGLGVLAVLVKWHGDHLAPETHWEVPHQTCRDGFVLWGDLVPSLWSAEEVGLEAALQGLAGGPYAWSIPET